MDEKGALLKQVEGAALRNKAYTEASCAAIAEAVAGELAERPTQAEVAAAIDAAVTGAIQASY